MTQVNCTEVDQAVTNDDTRALYNAGVNEMRMYAVKSIEIVRGKTQRQQSLIGKCGPVPLFRVQL